MIPAAFWGDAGVRDGWKGEFRLDFQDFILLSSAWGFCGIPGCELWV